MSQTKTAPPPATDDDRFGARHAFILASLFWTVQLVSVVALLGGNAQSEVAVHFHTTKVVWFTLVGTLVATFVMPFAVKAAAIWGKRRIMIIVTVVGLAGDVIAALAPTYGTMLTGRAIAGFYATAAPLAYALTRDVFPRRLVGTASGLLGGGLGLTALVGPFLSGWIIDDFGFRGALWFMVAATILSLVLLITVVPESPVREASGRIDWIGGLLLGSGFTAIVYGIGEGSTWGWTSGKFLAHLVAGLIALILFVAVENRVPQPLFPLALLRRRKVWTVLLTTSVAAGAVFAVGTVVQLLALMPSIPGLSDGLGWSATKNALVTSPMSLLILVAAVVTGTVARRFDTRYVLGVGTALAAVGLALGSHFHHSASELITMGVVAGLGIGMVVSIAPIMIIEAVAPEEQALANGAQRLLEGAVQVLTTQLAFVVMAQHGMVAKGTQFYLDAGFADGFWLVASICAVAVLLVLLIPKGKHLDESVVGQTS